MEFLRSTAPELCKKPDEIVREWNERDLGERVYPFLVVDAVLIRVQKDGRLRLCSVLVATGINQNGYREV
ncbi:MAG TPA: hypothetical protein GX510_09880 [Firmicutes bacterium]|nr:hypothetical protein [Candidatus Fermentithermobacillaceae bacterium]